MLMYILGIPCFFYKITNFYCPGCGFTRAVFALLHLNIYQALRYNVLIIIYIPLILYCIFYKFILKRDSSKLNLSQSEYIRNLIIGYEVKNPEVKEEIKNSIGEYIIEKILKTLEENIDCLIKVKNKFHYLGYFEDERAIGTKIEYLKLQNTTLKKYIPIENDKDNAN